MGWYRKSSRFFDGFRRCRNSVVRKSVPLTTNPLRSSSNPTGSRISQFSEPVLWNSVLQNVIKNNQCCKSPFLDGAKRFHSVDRIESHHFKHREFDVRIQNPRNRYKLGFLGLLGFGAATSVYFWNSETVHCLNRSNVVLLPASGEKQNEPLVEESKKEYEEESEKGYEGKIVPSHHPESIRVQRILQNIVESAPKGLRKKVVDDEEKNAIMRMMMNFFKKPSSNPEEFKWEIVLVKDPTINAFFAPSGKIFIFTGLLDFFEKDAEIAAIIGHEVSHGFEREEIPIEPWVSMLMLMYEKVSKDLWVMKFLQLTLDQLYQYFFPDNYTVYIISNLLLWLPLSPRTTEKEADYRGLVLMAAAGYDPRVALEVFKKLEKDVGSKELGEYYSTRVKLLSQPKVMEEALSLYKEVQAPHSRVEGSLQVFCNLTTSIFPSLVSFLTSA